MSKKQYSDHPEIYATVTVGKRQIKVRSSPESDAFLASVQVMSDPREVLGVGIWLSQMAPRLANCPERVIDNRGTPMLVDGRTLNPRCNEEGLSLMRSLARVEDRAQRIAVAEFLVATAEAFFLRACHMDPSIIGR